MQQQQQRETDNDEENSSVVSSTIFHKNAHDISWHDSSYSLLSDITPLHSTHSDSATE